MIQGLITLASASYVSKPWHGVLLFWATLALSAFINTVARKALSRFEGVIFIVHVLGFFAIVIPMVVLGPHAQSGEVWNTFMNNGQWPTEGVSFMIGLLGAVFPLTGKNSGVLSRVGLLTKLLKVSMVRSMYDCVLHRRTNPNRYAKVSQMAEEISNASTIVPYSIMTSVALNGTLGLAGKSIAYPRKGIRSANHRHSTPLTFVASWSFFLAGV